MSQEFKEAMKIESLGLPSMTAGKGSPGVSDWAKHRVRYMKVDMDDPTSVFEYEQIKTRGLRGEIALLPEQSFSCMTSFFIIVGYIEKEDSSVYKAPDPVERATPRATEDKAEKFSRRPQSGSDGSVFSI